MSSMRIGICQFPPFYYITSPTTINGVYAPILRITLVSIMTKVNVTLVSIDNCIHEKCYDNGTCIGPIEYLSKGKVDYIYTTEYDLINDLGTNLTIASLFSENSCYLAQKRQLRWNLYYSNFFDFLYFFGLDFWPMLMSIFVLLLIILNLIIKLDLTSINSIDIIWTQLSYILCQNRDQLFALISKEKLIIFILSLLIICKLLSSSLQTGLVSSPEYVKLDTLEDIIRYEYQPIAFEKIDCRREFQTELEEFNHKYSFNLTIGPIEGKKMIDHYHFIKLDKYVTVLTRDWTRVIKSIGCLFDRNYELNEPFEKSDIPVFKSLKGVLINKRNDPIINQIITQGSYWSFEAGFGQNELSTKLYSRCLGVADAPISCLDAKLESKIIAIPITLHYLLIPFAIMTFNYLIVSSVTLIRRFYS